MGGAGECGGVAKHTNLILRSRAAAFSKDGPRASWFETREDALLTMRGEGAWQGTANSHSPNGRNPVTLLKIAF
jgi:hypothetical protein